MKGFKSVLQAAASAAANATAAAAAATSAAVEAASGPRALREYVLLHPDKPEARAGLGGIWSVHLATPKRQGSAAALQHVSVWLLDKRIVLSTSTPSPEEGEAALAAARAGATALARVKHPSFLRVIETLEETRHLLCFVTEGVWGTASELMMRSEGDLSSSARAKEARSVSRLEVLHGLSNVTRAVTFLHRGSASSSSSSSSPSPSPSSPSSGIVHRALGPSAVVLTRSGGWKLAGMELSVPESDPACQRAGGSFFDFGDAGNSSAFGGTGTGKGGSSSSFPSLNVAAASRPELAFCSPELVEASTPLTTATDIFSLGALAASLLSARRAPLFSLPAGGSCGEPTRAHLSAVRALASSLGGLSSVGLPNGGCADPVAAACLAPLLAPDPAARPRAGEVEGLALFSSDEGLRAIRALEAATAAATAAVRGDSDGEEPEASKLRVLRRVEALLPSFDARVRELLVLPPLLLEARAAARSGGVASGASGSSSSGETLAVCLSVILDIAKQQAKADFDASTLPALRAVCANMFAAPSPKRKQQQAPQAAAAAAASEGGATTTTAPPPPPPPTTTATLAALVLLERAPFLASRCPPDLLLPLVCRALDTANVESALSSDASANVANANAIARAQELAAVACPSVGASAGPAASEAQLLPRLHRLALSTTAARVRAACFRALGELCAGLQSGSSGENAFSSTQQQQQRAPEPLPREASVAALASFARAAAVDGSASTAEAGIDLAASLQSRWGSSLSAQDVIPALAPLLAHSEEVLPDAAFARVAEAIRWHVGAIEAERARRRGSGRGGGGALPGLSSSSLPASASASAATGAAAAKKPAVASAPALAPKPQATLHPLFAAAAPEPRATTTNSAAAAAPLSPAVLLPLPPPPPPPHATTATSISRQKQQQQQQFFPPPVAAAAPALPSAADRVPSLGLTSDLFGEWAVAETAGDRGGSGELKSAAGTPLATTANADGGDSGNGGGSNDAAFDALFAAAAVSAKQRQQQQQQQENQAAVGSSGIGGAPMRPKPSPPPPPPPPAAANNGRSNSLI